MIVCEGCWAEAQRRAAVIGMFSTREVSDVYMSLCVLPHDERPWCTSTPPSTT